MNLTAKEKNNTPIHSLIRDRKSAFANLIRAYLKFNVPHAKKVDIVEAENRDVFIAINDNIFKLDISDYTGSSERYIFYNPSNGRLVIESGSIRKVYKIEVDLLDEDNK
jgi:hypothetical protein